MAKGEGVRPFSHRLAAPLGGNEVCKRPVANRRFLHVKNTLTSNFVRVFCGVLHFTLTKCC